MKERPILFSSEMVRAILEGRKTQTRRIVKIQPQQGERFVHAWGFGHRVWIEGQVKDVLCPYGKTGDRLWVRETWGDVTLAFQSHENEEPEVIAFRADEGVYSAHSMKRLEKMSDSGIAAPKWRPSIFLPRRFSRITLEITGVRVERLQDIHFHGMEAEGVLPPRICGGEQSVLQDEYFRPLWDGINGKRASWESNPWVWVVEFRRVSEAA